MIKILGQSNNIIAKTNQREGMPNIVIEETTIK